jgi:hypothetical protein
MAMPVQRRYPLLLGRSEVADYIQHRVYGANSRDLVFLESLDLVWSSPHMPSASFLFESRDCPSAQCHVSRTKAPATKDKTAETTAIPAV